LLDGTAPFYGVYETADGEHVAVGALEPSFFQNLCDGLGLSGHAAVAAQYDRSTWPAMRAAFEAAFASRPRAEWQAMFDGVDACVAPVLSLAEAPDHRHAIARRSFVASPSSGPRPVAAPRFSRTPGRST
jgi:alpha-methylacyl-CoA racemase